MVSRWEWPSTFYLAIKLEKFTECSARQIVKYKLNNNNKKILSFSYLSISDRKVGMNYSVEPCN